MMPRGKPNAREAAALDAYFVTVCDHGMNASTFTARVVASTQADLFCAVTGAYCALTGPLHGGAPGPGLGGEAAGKERLRGCGHRVSRVRDPRADVLKSAIERLGLGVDELPFAGE